MNFANVFALAETTNQFLRPSFIIPIAIAVAAIIACVIIFFVIPARREKTLKFFRGLKSESKKVTWYTWKQTWKGTLVVAVVSVALAVVIGLLDFGFTQGLKALADINIFG